MYHSTQQSDACEKSTLKVREVLVPHCRESNVARTSCSLNVGWAAATRKSRKSGRLKNLVEALHKAKSRMKA
eukprot:4293029-Pleurochrysis_carterae.AAC.1